MTNEKAIEIIKTVIGEDALDQHIDCDAAFEIVIEALKKRIPTKVTNITTIQNPFGGINSFAGKCVCGELVSGYSNYCSKCGQALDWSRHE